MGKMHSQRMKYIDYLFQPEMLINVQLWERSGSLVDCLTRDSGPQIQASRVSLRCGP